MTLLVLGHAGQVATELRQNADVIALGRGQLDLRQPGALQDALDTHAPDAVINAAAYTAVDQAEQDVDAAMFLNAEVPGRVARACATRDIPFLHVSTDYVFDGSQTRPWGENDEPAPLNLYGRSKLAGEIAVAEAGGTYAILRTSWVFSSHGNNFVKTMLRLAETRTHLNIVSDQIGGPTPADDIAQTLLIMAHALKKTPTLGGVFHYAGDPAVSWAEFARTIFADTGAPVSVTDIPSSEYPTPAPRPLNSRLNCQKIADAFGCQAPDWRAGLQRVLTELASR